MSPVALRETGFPSRTLNDPANEVVGKSMAIGMAERERAVEMPRRLEGKAQLVGRLRPAPLRKLDASLPWGPPNMQRPLLEIDVSSGDPSGFSVKQLRWLRLKSLI